MSNFNNRVTLAVGAKDLQTSAAVHNVLLCLKAAVSLTVTIDINHEGNIDIPLF